MLSMMKSVDTAACATRSASWGAASLPLPVNAPSPGCVHQWGQPRSAALYVETFPRVRGKRRGHCPKP